MRYICIYLCNLLLLFIKFILLSLKNVLKMGNGPKPVDNCNDRLFTNLASSIYIYIYIYMCVCVCHYYNHHLRERKRGVFARRGDGVSNRAVALGSGTAQKRREPVY